MSEPIICVDCSPLLVRSAGVKTYLYYLLKSMIEGSPESIRTFLAPRDLERLNHDGGPRMHPARTALLLALNKLPEIFCDIAIGRCDVFHSSNMLRTPPGRPRLTATIHDLTAWILPEFHTPATVTVDSIFAKNILKRAAGLIAVSENTKRDAVKILGLSPERIRVIPLGIPPSYSNVSRDSVGRVVAKYNLRRPWFLFIGTIEPRKNVDTLLAAWRSLPDFVAREHELLIVGMPGWRSEATMAALREANRGNWGIRYLGYVPEGDLPALTSGARAFVYPSLYEGFGIPVAQAMAAGCPVITSNVSSLPEVTGGAALLIDPRSVSELGTALRKLIESPELGSQLASAGVEKARKYTWTAAAEKTLEFFREIA